MVLRIKSRWPANKRNAVSAAMLHENAGALAFIAWRLALEHARNLHGEGFDYLSDHERIGVITEFCAFIVSCTDRLTFARLDTTGRETFINALALRIGDQIQDNLTDLAGAGNYHTPFVALLNQRLADYAHLSFEDEPGFDFLRYLGAQVLTLMGETQTNRWVIDQVMSIDGPEVFDKLTGAVANLFDTGQTEPDNPAAC
jgi:hypothetical protein